MENNYATLLKNTNEYVSNLLKQYNKQYTEEEEKFLFKNIDKNKVGFIHEEFLKEKINYFDKWYDNTLVMTGLAKKSPARSLCKSLSQYVGSDFSVCVYKKKPIIIKNSDIIQYGCFEDISQLNVIRNIFFYILSIHDNVYSFYSSFHHLGDDIVIYKKRVVTEWLEQELNCVIYDNEKKTHISRAIFPTELYYHYEKDKLKKIEVNIEFSKMKFDFKNSKIIYNVLKDASCPIDNIMNIYFSKNPHLNNFVITFNCLTQALTVDYFDSDKKLCNPKICFITNPRRYDKISRLHFEFPNHYNSEFVNNRYNLFAKEIINQCDFFYENKNYFNVYELFGSIFNCELANKETKNVIKNKWKKWIFKTPITRTLAMICLTGRGGLPRLPIEMIEHIIQFLIG